MKEPQDTRVLGSTSNSAADTTAELLADGTTTPLQSTQGKDVPEQAQEQQISKELQLVVVEGTQIGRGVARVDPNDIARLGCQPGDIVLISGSRTTAAKVVPSALTERGQQSIQMDSQVRQNSASGLGERVMVRKANVHNAEKISLLPLNGGTPIQESDLQYIARSLVG